MSDQPAVASIDTIGFRDRKLAGLAVVIWALYLAIAVFADKAYGGLGLMLAASALVAMAVSWAVGRLVDRGRGRQVLLVSSLVEALAGALRWFVTGIPQAVGHNFLQQQQVGHNLTLFQWYFDKSRPQAERPAFFLAYSYIHDLTFALIAGGLALLLASAGAGSQVEILRAACIIIGVGSGLAIAGLSLTRPFRPGSR